MFKSVFIYIDGKVEEYKSRHMMRCDGGALVYRIMRERKEPFSDKTIVVEETIPYCVIRRQWTEVIDDEN